MDGLISKANVAQTQLHPDDVEKALDIVSRHKIKAIYAGVAASLAVIIGATVVASLPREFSTASQTSVSSCDKLFAALLTKEKRSEGVAALQACLK